MGIVSRDSEWYVDKINERRAGIGIIRVRGVCGGGEGKGVCGGYGGGAE